MQLLAVIGDATTTLDVCVFTITCNELADAIIAAAKRKVRVRVITDDIQATSQGSDVSELARTPGVTLRTDHQKEAHMHHKFAIVDSTLLLNGSFNWTERAVSENCENVVISRWANQFVIFCETLNSNFPGGGHWWMSLWTSLRKCLPQLFASVLPGGGCQPMEPPGGSSPAPRDHQAGPFPHHHLFPATQYSAGLS